jgi:hypothetical protein
MRPKERLDEQNANVCEKSCDRKKLQLRRKSDEF